MTAPLPALRAGGLAILLVVLAACSGRPSAVAQSPFPAARATASASPVASASPPASAPPGTVDVDRALAHVQALSRDIGVRSAGTEAERRAARYIGDVLTAQGYAVTIEPFTFRERFDNSTARLPGGVTLSALYLEGSPFGTASGVLTEAGTGLPAEIASASVRGRVVMVRRGGISFAQKVANAEQAGAVAVLVVNNGRGLFRGNLGEPGAGIPALAIDGNDLERLRAALGQAVTVEAAGGTREVASQNVVGRRGPACRAYIAAHYDSVPQGPGANDNATGTASMLELARARGTDGLCAIAFGSEESGLFGSKAYVAAHPGDRVAFVLNFDMMGRIDDPIIVGDGALTQRILDIIGQGPEQPLRAGQFPPNASSDHVSFSTAGVPAVTITSGDDPAIHTPGDAFEAVRRPDLGTMLGLGNAALAGLLKGLDAR